MNYESFIPINKSAEKRKNTFLQRFLIKLNKPNVENAKEVKEVQKVKSESIENLNNIKKPKSRLEYQSAENSPIIYRSSHRHSEDILQDKMSFTRLIKTVTSNLSTTIRESSENLSVKQKVDRGYWMPDSICHKCYSCEEEFNTIKRRHHCRMCGQIFCYRCCSFELPGSLWNLPKPQRSCRICFLSFCSQTGSKSFSPRSNRSNRNSGIYHRNSKLNLSPRGSIVSENINPDDNNLQSSNKNLSFSSNDIHMMSDHNVDGSSMFNPVADPDSESIDLEEFDQFSDVKKSTTSEIEELTFEQKHKKPERRTSLNKAYHKYFFPAHILSKEKLFGHRGSIFAGSASSSQPVDNSFNQSNHKRDLLTIWKLIIQETETYRRNYFTKIRLQSQTRKLEQRFSFPNDEENVLINTLPIIVTEVNASKSCINGHSLIDWIITTTEVTERFRATAICQSYLEMELLFPFFNQDDIRLFKDDSTLYVIREFTADCSPRMASSNVFFTDTELMGHLVKNNNQQSFGNSIFYADEDHGATSNGLNNENESQFSFKSLKFIKIKSPTLIQEGFSNNNYEEKLGESISQKVNTFLWNRSCKYLERLLKQELHDYNLDTNWCHIILPICKLVSEKISPSNNGEKLINDIRNFIQIKKIPNTTKNDCRIHYSISMSKNIDFPMKKDMRNPSVIFIRSSIDYWRHKKLVSLDPLLLQEEEYLKNCVIKIKNLGPDIVVVEGSVSLIAKDMMEKWGLVLISNVRKEQIERLSRMLGATIFDSVDSLGTNVESVLGKCSQFSVQKYKLTNGRDKHLLFFKLCNPKHGCTLTLHGESLSELVRVKYVTKFIIIAFKNAVFELACLMNFQIRPFQTNTSPILKKSNEIYDKSSNSIHVQNESPSTFLDIIENRCFAMSVNVTYCSPAAVLRSISNPELQSRLLSSDIINLSWKERLNDVLKRKQRHICAEIYDFVRMKTLKHPLMCQPGLHAFTNCFFDKEFNNKEQCMLYTDFRVNGSRFHPVNSDMENSLISTINFDSSDLACKVGFLTKNQEVKWRNLEKKKFESIFDSFNPRNYQRIFLLYSIQTQFGMCEKPRKISLNYYDNTDRTLGNFVSSMLNDVTSCPIKCDCTIFDHVYKFVSNSGCIKVSLHQLDSDSHFKLINSLPSDIDLSTIKLWNWCSRCDKLLGLQPMSDETWHLSLGRFFDILFNMNLSDTTLFPGQCFHSLQTDIHYYFTQNSVNKALEMKYVPITVYEFQTPDLFISFNQNDRRPDSLLETFKCLQSDIDRVAEIKTRYNLEIKEKLCKLKSVSKEKDNELWDFLKQDSNSEQYSKKVHDLYNLMEEIHSPLKNKIFDCQLFTRRENHIKDEIVHLWTDVVTVVSKWDLKLAEAFDREEKNDKRTSKTDPKLLKNSNDNLQIEQELSMVKSYPIIKSDRNKEFTNKPVFSSQNQVETDDKKKFMWNSSEDSQNTTKVDTQYLDIPYQERPLSRTSTELSFENIDEIEINSIKKERINSSRESELKQISQIEKTLSSNNNTMQPLRKLFPSLFNSVGYKILDDPINLNNSYSFQNIESIKVPVVVTDEFISSVVAFSLSSDVYLETLNEYSRFSNIKENEKFEIISKSIIPTQSQKTVSELSYIESLNISNGSPILSPAKLRTAKLESITKDRELSVRYFHHTEPEEYADTFDQDSPHQESKQETGDIQIEVSTEDNLVDEPDQKPVSSSKHSGKVIPNCDFVINFSNYKVKCVCKMYYAKQFHDLRKLIFKNDDTNYIRSLSECKSWVTTGGKSGLKFRKTLDDRFIIKQMHVIELEGFRKFHQKYFDYILERIARNQKCILAKILGVYHVDYSNSLTKANEKMDFLVMENLFFDQKPCRIFDLKGNKQGAVNISTDKLSVADNSVMQDKDFINYCRTKPLYVSWQAQIALKETLTRDTDFLQSLPVMDYSLLVGVDDNNEVLLIGIIDYLRMFTMNKLIEMHFKQKLLTPHGEQPTVIQPQKYQKRFLEAMEEYFLISPIPWDYLLLYPSNPNIASNCNKKQSFSFNFPSVSTNKSPRLRKKMKSLEKPSDENTLRLGLTGSI